MAGQFFQEANPEVEFTIQKFTECRYPNGDIKKKTKGSNEEKTSKGMSTCNKWCDGSMRGFTKGDKDTNSAIILKRGFHTNILLDNNHKF